MTDRFRAVKRVLSVQTQMHRLAQWKLSQLEQRETTLRENQESLLRFLDQEGSYTALFGDALMRRLRNIGEEKVQVAAAKVEQSERTMEESRRVGRMQRMADSLSEEARREEDKLDLRDTLERINHRRNASPR